MPEVVKPSEQFITLSEVLKSIDKGDRFDVAFVTANVKMGTGGEIKQMYGCMKHLTGRGGKAPAAPTKDALAKNPHHYQNSTRNIRQLNTGDIRKLHIRLIISYNGKTVMP